ncbi:MAG: Rad52/Rad22 family DNA repair protein [Gemmatimonadetes bacterium]|nr:Rad52/Rad22 family DNA repair protein [Gemmatimonadota bacterium]
MSQDKSKLAGLYEAFEKEFDNDAVRSRKVRGGKTIRYVPAPPVIRRLNEVAPDWEFEVDFVSSIMVKETRYDRDNKPYDVEYNQIAVVGKLTIEGVPRQQFGSGDDDGATYGEGLKGAGTDALKKCASLFGIALYLYEEDENPRPGNGGGGHGGGGARRGNPDQKASEKQRAMLRGKADDMEDIGNEQLATDLRRAAEHAGLTNQHVDNALAAYNQAKDDYEATKRRAEAHGGSELPSGDGSAAQDQAGLDFNGESPPPQEEPPPIDDDDLPF